MTSSIAVDEAIRMAELDGNSLKEITTGWTKLKEVVHMSEPMSDALRTALFANANLRSWQTDPTPHNGAEEGFTDDEAKVAITFPRGFK